MQHIADQPVKQHVTLSGVARPGNGLIVRKQTAKTWNAAFMSDDEDDVPPPLSSLRAQQEALSRQQQASADASGVTATVTVAPRQHKQATKQAPVIKRGFLDAKPKPARARQKPAAQEQQMELVEEIPVVRSKGKAAQAIPEMFMLPPDAKAQLTDALKPNPDMLEGIMGNPALMKGFDDPEVMAAVDDVAKHPENLQKYRGNPKVMAFYQQMSGMVGGRLEQLADEQNAKPSRRRS